MMERVCCMRLSTAGVVLGWIGVVSSFVLTILLSTILGNADVIARSIVGNMTEDAAKYDEIHMGLIVSCSVYLGIFVLNLLASAMLILGTMKERHLMLLPWLINSGVGLILSIIYNFVVLILALSSAQIDRIVPVLIVTFIGLGLHIYIYCGIYSLFKQIQRTREQQQPLINQSQGANVPAQGNSYPSYTKI
ncbi:uncharacterized protein [Drosophila virilis]|uniref:Uncharacterized protein n=1 Tax=Drosophila virilis TaxID=7244 RepID=B4LQ83_DROVI|nr:uncharacterized protein LOC6626988 [Drosophila virilis]EDW61368.1 uncharacterized protein Dvir_GJ21998 [Drosophila virilis]